MVPLGPPSGSGPSCGPLYNVRKNKGESMRVFPLSNWTELDVWQYIMREGIEKLRRSISRPSGRRSNVTAFS